jgi:hypothetical protein
MEKRENNIRVKSSIFWAITPCRPFEIELALLTTIFTLISCFDPEGGGDMFLRNFGRLSAYYTALYPQKIKLFITTGVRTSNLKHWNESLGAKIRVWTWT